jgi:hypothetical protein
MKKLLLLAALIASLISSAQTTVKRDTIPFGPNKDSAVVVETTTTIATKTGTVTYTYRDTSTQVSTFKVVLRLVPPNQAPSASIAPVDPITLPVNSVNLIGTGLDPDGTIAAYLWTKISGPTNFVIGSPTQSSTSVIGLVEGTYVFKLAVTDNEGATAAAQVTITVNPQPAPGPASPFEGFGAQTTGGAGFDTVWVTNKNASGAGSFYNAIGSKRVVAFKVGGAFNNIRWDASDENKVIDHLTIAGSTAKNLGGVQLANGSRGGNVLSFQNGCHDIIVENIEASGAGNDGFNCVSGCYNIVFDHCTSFANGDGDLDITDACHDITIQNCLLGDAFSGAILIAYKGTKNISVHHSLFNSRGSAVGERNPLVHNANNNQPQIDADLKCDFRNNIVWNWGKKDGGYGYGSQADYGGKLQLINNFYQSNILPNLAVDRDHNSSGSVIYASGNISGNAGVNANALSNKSDGPWPVALVTTQTACAAAVLVKLNAGAMPRSTKAQVLVSAVSLANCPTQ